MKKPTAGAYSGLPVGRVVAEARVARTKLAEAREIFQTAKAAFEGAALFSEGYDDELVRRAMEGSELAESMVSDRVEKIRAELLRQEAAGGDLAKTGIQE